MRSHQWVGVIQLSRVWRSRKVSLLTLGKFTMNSHIFCSLQFIVINFIFGWFWTGTFRKIVWSLLREAPYVTEGDNAKDKGDQADRPDVRSNSIEKKIKGRYRPNL